MTEYLDYKVLYYFCGSYMIMTIEIRVRELGSDLYLPLIAQEPWRRQGLM